MKFRTVLAIALASLSYLALAHEGHSDTSLKSLHGGIVKKTSNAYIEVVQEEGKTEIFVTGHDYKNIVDAKLQLKADVELKSKKMPVELKIDGDHYVVTTDLKKEKHFKLNVSINNNKKVELANFALENN